MKLSIVTVYNSINSGSFWQAKALEIYLKNKGHEVYFYKRNNKGIRASSSKINQLLKKIKMILNGRIEDLKIFNSTLKAFDKMTSKFNVIDKNSKIYKDIDCFILGSDTIWNVNEEYFYKEYRTYFGGIFDKKRVISYAASVGNTNEAIIKKLPNITKYIDNIKEISVRDNHTLAIVNNISNNEPFLVCDPTLLLSKRDYEKIIESYSVEKPKDKYIFIYLFENLEESQIRDVISYAKKNKLKIISGTRKFKWCDECIINEPLNFLNYMLNAYYVITDTFHGTIFSVNLNKQFSVIERNKNKVNEFLNYVNMSDRKENYKVITNFSNTIDYEKDNIELNKYIQYSKEFLNSAIIDE